ncbi:MAG: hypothetical protein AAF934_00340 [Bacteroidota bacterium]
MRIIFELEAPDDQAAFYGLYAGLRMYKELKVRELIKKEYKKRFLKSPSKTIADFISLKRNIRSGIKKPKMSITTAITKKNNPCGITSI